MLLFALLLCSCVQAITLLNVTRASDVSSLTASSGSVELDYDSVNSMVCISSSGRNGLVLAATTSGAIQRIAFSFRKNCFFYANTEAGAETEIGSANNSVVSAGSFTFTPPTLVFNILIGGSTGSSCCCVNLVTVSDLITTSSVTTVTAKTTSPSTTSLQTTTTSATTSTGTTTATVSFTSSTVSASVTTTAATTTVQTVSATSETETTSVSVGSSASSSTISTPSATVEVTTTRASVAPLPTCCVPNCGALCSCPLESPSSDFICSNGLWLTSSSEIRSDINVMPQSVIEVRVDVTVIGNVVVNGGTLVLDDSGCLSVQGSLRLSNAKLALRSGLSGSRIMVASATDGISGTFSTVDVSACSTDVQNGAVTQVVEGTSVLVQLAGPCVAPAIWYWIVAGVCIGVALLAAATLLIFIYVRRRRNASQEKAEVEMSEADRKLVRERVLIILGSLDKGEYLI